MVLGVLIAGDWSGVGIPLPDTIVFVVCGNLGTDFELVTVSFINAEDRFGVCVLAVLLLLCLLPVTLGGGVVLVLLVVLLLVCMGLLLKPTPPFLDLDLDGVPTAIERPASWFMSVLGLLGLGWTNIEEGSLVSFTANIVHGNTLPEALHTLHLALLSWCREYSPLDMCIDSLGSGSS